MAINYILPNMYDSYFCNLTIANKLLQEKNICGVSGTFPFSIFNGSYNNIGYEKVCLYDDMKDFYKNYGIMANMVIIDCGNPLLESFDYFDLYNQVILQEFASKPNFYFSVTQEEFIDYLIEKYPTIQLILHQNYTRNHSSKEIQLLLNKYPNIKGIIISSFNTCKDVKDVFKIYLTPLHGCEECAQYQKCLEYDHHSTLEYSIDSQFSKCSLRKLIYPEIIQQRIEYAKEYCDYIMFDTVVGAQEIEEYALIETVISQMEE